MKLDKAAIGRWQKWIYELFKSYIHACDVYDLGKYEQKIIHIDIYKVTKGCIGCMYGSYPEVTITARYMSAFIERARYFNIKTPKLKKYSKAQLQDIANDILNEQTWSVKIFTFAKTC